MTRCKLLDEWFDAKSKEVDEAEEKNQEVFCNGDKKCQ